MEYIKYCLIYDLKSKIILGSLSNIELAKNINKDLYGIKELELLPNQHYIGSNIDDIQIITDGEKTIVREVEVLSNMFTAIDNRYDQYDINRILFELLEENENIKKTDEFISLVKFFKVERKKADLKIETAKKFSDRFIFISIDDEKQRLENKLSTFSKNLEH